MKKTLRSRITSILVCASLITASSAALGIHTYADDSAVTDSAAETVSTANKKYKIQSKKANIYIGPEKIEQTKLYYINGSDVPYMMLEDWVDYYNMLGIYAFENADFNVAMEKVDESKVMLMRENGCPLIIDFDEDIIDFWDYNGFTLSAGTSLMDLSEGIDKNDDGTTKYIRKLDSSTQLFGDEIIMNFADYDIDLVRKGDHYFIPLQTLSDLFLAPQSLCILFNGKSIILYSSSFALKDSDGNLTKTGKLYYNNGGTGKISEEMAKYNYNELCFAFDHLYGLKDQHSIENFRQLVLQRGEEQIFLSTDQKLIDEAIFSIIQDSIDDLHSAYSYPSYASGPDLSDELTEKYGISRSTTNLLSKYLELYRAQIKHYPDGVPGYEEIGDTAFITFGNFTMNEKDYYSEAPTANSTDTIGIISYSVQQILRKDSPIKNVVLDLSLNTGGTVPSAIYTLGAFLGTASLSVSDPNTGALVTNDYSVDTNLDGKFDENDTLDGKGLNLYCITSKVSFSCGNLVPCAFKDSAKVTLLGQTSGGGSCSVMTISSATGTIFTLSSSMRMSFLKNGSFYDIDRGADPDHWISKADSYYDREKLVEYIDSLL